MQITKTEYKAELLEQWKADKTTEEKINEELEKYLGTFNDIFNYTLRSKNFGVYIKGLLSPLKRKSVEPIALVAGQARNDWEKAASAPCRILSRVQISTMV